MATPAATRIPILELSAVTEIPTATKMAVFGDPDGNGIRLLGYMDMGSGFIPLSGTEVGKPITGDLELSDNASLFYEGPETFQRIKFKDEDVLEINVEQKEFAGDDNGRFIFQTNQLYLELTDVETPLGIIGNSLYNKLNDPFAFAQLGDIAEVNATVLPLSLATLNADYATQGAGFRVCCPNLNLDYIKDTLTTWHSVATTTVV